MNKMVRPDGVLCLAGAFGAYYFVQAAKMLAARGSGFHV